ncbi:hypothetical protein SAY87_012707 [Trapa incisa]|uniref:Uncharacterized protein n=2 Tax=Trapa TaxID=22665 RepID=A0AAN7LI82_TRANT|nr:hypothetical protein SAY87_012707 [Trapa incisa]KAK4787227.1 hypothetical protein SAY86_011060 [Trapa natans]
MGNCCTSRSSSATVWAGDDWSDSDVSPVGDHTKKRDPILTSVSDSSGSRTVKIKMTKRELEKLLEDVDVNSMSLGQVLAGLSGASGDDFSFRRRAWRPALQSIPEIN